MSPTGFGSVPCEKLEVLLDNERLALIDWQGGGRFGVTPPNCGRGRGAAAPAPAQAGQGGGGFNRNAVPKMTVRFKATAGLHTVGVTFPQTNFAPLLDLDQHFQRDTLQTGPTPGFTFFPHVGTVRIEGPYNATDATDSPSRRKDLRVPPGRRRRRHGVRSSRGLPARDARLSASCLGGRRGPADEVLRRRPQGRRVRSGRRDGAGPPPRVAKIHLSHRGRARECETERAVSHQRSRPGVAAVVLPVEHAGRISNC